MHVDSTTVQEISDTITTAVHRSIDKYEGQDNISLGSVWTAICVSLTINFNLVSNRYLRDSIAEWARYVDLPTYVEETPHYISGYAINTNDERMMTYLKHELSMHLVKTVLRDISRL